MGIDLSLIARPPRKLKNLFRALPDPKRAIIKSLNAVANEKSVELFLPQFEGDQSNDVTFHLLCESVHVSLESGAYRIDVRTNGGGPGYHAFVCDVADHLAKTQGWTFAPDDQVDETGFFQSRDFSMLQSAQAEWLKSLARALSSDATSKDGVSRIMLALDTPVPAVEESMSYTPNGPVGFGFLKDLSAMEGQELLDAAARWFPWWSRTPSGLDYSNFCRQLMWTEVAWHPPANKNELAIIKAVFASAELARSCDPNIALPDAELAELSERMTAKAPLSPPKLTGIGYRRQLCWWMLPGGWSVKLPGYWLTDQDDGSTIFSFNDMFVRASAFNVETKAGSASETIELPPLGEGMIEIDSWESQQQRMRFGKPIERQDDKNVSRMLVAAKKDNILLLTCGGDDEDFADVAHKIARSVT